MKMEVDLREATQDQSQIEIVQLRKNICAQAVRGWRRRVSPIDEGRPIKHFK